MWPTQSLRLHMPAPSPPPPPAPQDAHFARRYSEILESAAVVFKDADDDFATLAAVKRKLEEWKSRWVQERSCRPVYTLSACLAP